MLLWLMLLILLLQLMRSMFFVSIDQSDIDLRNALANLVGVVLGSPTSSNHLWYHMFAADKLENTYMTGFMVS